MNKMKKISIITIILYMLFITSSFASTATIDVNSARLREAANTTSKVLTNIYKGEKVEILEKDGEWYKVKYGNNIGYLKNTLIKEEESVSSEETTKKDLNSGVEDSQNEGSNKVVLKDDTVVRNQPNMMSNTIISVETGKELTKELEIGKWIKVSDGAIEGWILKSKTENQESQINEVVNTNNTNTILENNTNTTNTLNENKVNTNTVSNKVTNTVVNKVQNTTTVEEKENISSNVGNKKGKVNVETAKVRKEASTTAKIVGFLDYNDEITIIAEEGEFYKFTEKTVSGYVHKSLVTPIEENVSSRGNIEERVQEVVTDNKVITEEPKQEVSIESNNTTKGKDVADLALKYKGYKYVVGGKNPESGFDCSGFTRYIFLQFGYSLGNTAASQNNLGVEVERNALKEGDLILFYDDAKTKIGHTGIYISNGDFIHSANPERGVVIDNINTNSYYNERYIVAKRIVE